MTKIQFTSAVLQHIEKLQLPNYYTALFDNFYYDINDVLKVKDIIIYIVGKRLCKDTCLYYYDFKFIDFDNLGEEYIEDLIKESKNLVHVKYIGVIVPSVTESGRGGVKIKELSFEKNNKYLIELDDELFLSDRCGKIIKQLIKE